MSFIKNQNAIQGYSYIDFGIDFGRRMTAEQVFAFANQLQETISKEAKHGSYVQIKSILLEHPEDGQ